MECESYNWKLEIGNWLAQTAAGRKNTTGAVLGGKSPCVVSAPHQRRVTWTSEAVGLCRVPQGIHFLKGACLWT